MPAMGDDVSTDRGHGPLLQGFITCLPFKMQVNDLNFNNYFLNCGQ